MSLFPFLDAAPSDLIFTFLLPFIFVFALLFGLLSEVKWFEKRINLIISLSSSLMIFASGAPTLIIQTIPSFAYFAFGAFIFIFVVGVLQYGRGKTVGVFRRTMGPTKKLLKMNEEIQKLKKEMIREKNAGHKEKAAAIYQTIKMKEQERDMEQMAA